MNFVRPLDLHALAQEAGDGTTHNGPWVPVHDFIEGDAWVDVQAIDGSTTLALTVDFANADKSIVGASGLAFTNMTTVSQQGPIAVCPYNSGQVMPAFLRINWNITNAKKCTFRVALDGRGQSGH